MALLLCRFRIDEAHFRPLSCNHDSLGICRIVLLPLHKRFYVMRRNQLYLMAEPDHLACPIMRAATRSEEHTSELQSLMHTSYAVFCMKNNKLRNHYPSCIFNNTNRHK